MSLLESRIEPLASGLTVPTSKKKVKMLYSFYQFLAKYEVQGWWSITCVIFEGQVKDENGSLMP